VELARRPAVARPGDVRACTLVGRQARAEHNTFQTKKRAAPLPMAGTGMLAFRSSASTSSIVFSVILFAPRPQSSKASL
jgi:hypothetical protein